MDLVNLADQLLQAFSEYCMEQFSDYLHVSAIPFLIDLVKNHPTEVSYGLIGLVLLILGFLYLIYVFFAEGFKLGSFAIPLRYCTRNRPTYSPTLLYREVFEGSQTYSCARCGKKFEPVIQGVNLGIVELFQPRTCECQFCGACQTELQGQNVIVCPGKGCGAPANFAQNIVDATSISD